MALLCFIYSTRNQPINLHFRQLIETKVKKERKEKVEKRVGKRFEYLFLFSSYCAISGYKCKKKYECEVWSPKFSSNIKRIEGN